MPTLNYRNGEGEKKELLPNVTVNNITNETTVDGQLDASSSNPVENGAITVALGLKMDKADSYTKQEVDNLLSLEEVVVGDEPPETGDWKLFVDEDENSEYDFVTKGELELNYYSKLEIDKIIGDINSLLAEV